MRFISYQTKTGEGVAVSTPTGYVGLPVSTLGSDLRGLLEANGNRMEHACETLMHGDPVDLDNVRLLPPIPRPHKIICIGLNYADHTLESGYDLPAYPTVFGRFPSSLVAHGSPLIRPLASAQLDYEGELAVIIGRRGRHILETDALAYVAGYSLFNDASLRDYQLKSPQWTIGKNFDGTGSFGPELVTADELPPGCAGLRLETRLNGKVVQSASTRDLIFNVAKLIAVLSEVLTLEPGDVIVSGTPAGVGVARNPPEWMKPGDRCDVEIEGIGILSNPIESEPTHQ